MNSSLNEVGISREIYQLSYKLGLLDMGFIYKLSYSNTHCYVLRDYTVWLNISHYGNLICNVTSCQNGVVTLNQDFKSKRKLLRLLVDVKCAEAIEIMRHRKIDKLLGE